MSIMNPEQVESTPRSVPGSIYYRALSGPHPHHSEVVLGPIKKSAGAYGIPGRSGRSIFQELMIQARRRRRFRMHDERRMIGF
jgi:hypothetical protein